MAIFRFNGATASLPWNLRRQRASPDVGHRASMGPRHHCRGIYRISSTYLNRRFASMGPRHHCRGIPARRGHGLHRHPRLQWGHGITAVESRISRGRADPGKRRFNGATASLPWNRGARGRHDSGLLASMGPRHHCRGISVTLSMCCTWPWLQWGHGITAVESPSRNNRPHHIIELQWGHGITAVESTIRINTSKLRLEASMGPRHHCRGIEINPGHSGHR
ncbi:MAG: hypothetical protein OJF47_000525 [Nitrospira sp.]|nr:MAG: hypothetical protein OJF47_000525 [Nitrospira sp.]